MKNISSSRLLQFYSSPQLGGDEGGLIKMRANHYGPPARIKHNMYNEKGFSSLPLQGPEVNAPRHL